MSKAPFILLVNPWIADFAAHDLWASPLGLLSLAALLREGGCGVAFLDCLDRRDPLTNSHPDVLAGADRGYGTGKYPRMRIPKPDAYAGFPRHYHRYGIHPDSFRKQLLACPVPDLVWVTSMMTYWYPGVVETIGAIREVFPDVPVWLGGIYARLCPMHAMEKSGADETITLETGALPEKIEVTTGFTVRNKTSWGSFPSWPLPAMDLVGEPGYAPVLTGRGCPFHCPYCASGILQPKVEKRDAASIYREIATRRNEQGIEDFAFYDDALLLDADRSLKPVLERLCKEGLRVRFHTPNALHVRALTPEWCRLLFESGFTTLRLGLETTRSDRQREWGGKVDTDSFASAVVNLLTAGFAPEQVGVYLLCGLPGQTPEDVAGAIRVVKEVGVEPHLAEYAPAPGTPMWREAAANAGFDIEGEPLYHNNTFFACRRPGFSLQDLRDLKDLALRARRAVRAGAATASFPTPASGAGNDME